MWLRRCLWLASSVIGLCACGPSEPGVGPAPSVALPTATSTPPAAAPEAPAPVDAARLPRGAAVYFAARIGALDDLARSLPEMSRGRDRLLGQLGAKSLAEVLAAAGVAKDRPLLGAMLSPDEPAVRKAMAGALKDPTKPSPSQMELGSLLRVIVPLEPGAQVSHLVDRLARMEREPTVERCPASPSCREAGGEGLVALIRTVGGIVSVRARGAIAEIDQYTPFLPDGTDPAAVRGLAVMASAPIGGPEPGRCSRFDPAAEASLCVDADRTAVFGVATGYGLAMGAVLLSSGNIDMAQRLRVLEQGKQEADRNLELAAPKRRLVDDGTMVFRRDGERLSAVATWALTPESKPALEQAFAKPTCAAGQGFTSDVLPKLRKAFGDPGPDFAAPKVRLEHLKEAGWTGFPIVMSRIWPNFLPALMAELAPKVTELLGPGQVCAVVKDGRFELQSGAP